MRLLRIGYLSLSMLGACSMAELAPGEGEDALSKSSADFSWNTSDLKRDGVLWTQANSSWSRGAFVTALPQFPSTGFAWPDTSPSVLLANEQDYPLLLQGEASYRCADGVGEPQRLSLARPGTASAPLLLPEHSSLGLALSCVPVASKLSLLYRAVAPDGTVPFHDAASVADDGSSFSADRLMRLDAETPVARSERLSVAGKASATLYIRYSYPESEGRHALVKVGIQNGSSCATMRAFGRVKFPATPVSTSWDQWHVIAVKFAPGNVASIYARLQMKNGRSIHLDSAWIR
jgi:hypothetical protein